MGTFHGRLLRRPCQVADDGLVNDWMGDSVYHLANCRHDVDYIVDLIEAPDLVEEVLRAIDAYQEIRMRCPVTPGRRI